MPRPRTRLVMSDRQTAVFDSRITIDDETGCWNWSGPFHTSGYGQYSIARMPYRIHQLAYWRYKGDVPAGLEIDHLCRNRICCNPEHLEAVTHQVNMARAFAARTACDRGHEYTEENTRITRRARKDGSIGIRRDCRACHRIYDAQRPTRRKVVA